MVIDYVENSIMLFEYMWGSSLYIKGVRSGNTKRCKDW